MTVDHAHPLDHDGVANARDRALSAADADRVTGLLAVLADPVVVRIVSALGENEGTSAAELAAVLGVPWETVVSALRRLSDHGVVRNDQRSAPSRYRLARADLAQVVTRCGRRAP